MSKASRPVSKRRFNLRAAIIMGVGLLVLVAGFFAIKAYRGKQSRALFLQEAKKNLDSNRPDLALQYLNQYLTMNAADVAALDLKAKILADTARTAEQALEAMPIHNQVLGLDPENPKRQETRRRLVELNLKIGGRTKAAETLARELIRRGANDASAHRLLAQALEGEGAEGNVKALEEASREYEAAERIEPGDVDGAERLARLYRDKLNNSTKALEVLDHLVELHRKQPAKLAMAHLARSRYFAGSDQADRADAEIAEALKADPASVDVQLAAADAANRRGDTATAKTHLGNIPSTARGDLRIKLVEGLIELSEQRPDEAIRSWRDGLVQTGGNNAELTWRLAQVLLDIGRAEEADPLIAQYRRLIGGDEPNVFYRYLNGFALFKKGRSNEAITELEAIRYKAPKSLEAHLNYVLGQCYEQANDTLKAMDAYREATKANPQWSTPWIAIANLEAAERLGDANRTLEQGLAVNPNDPRLLVNSALLLWRRQLELPAEKRTWTEFEQILDRVEKVAPNSVEGALVRADYLATLGKSDDALARLVAVTKANPKSAPLWMAQANLLNRLGRSTEAIETLNQAIAADPQANFFVLRASYLLALGHLKEARSTLLDGLNRVPSDQRSQIWKTLGELAVKQDDRVAARHAFGQWAKLQPNSPEPRAALLELAMNAGDDAAIRAEVDALKGIGGPKAPYWRLARIDELLRDHSSESTGASKEARFNEAATLIREIQASQPFSASGYLVEGRLMEKQGQTDKAIAAYEKAMEQRGGKVALGPLMSLLVRERRDADLDRIRKKLPVVPPDLDRLATVEALKSGDNDRAEQLAAQMVEGNPQGLDARIWQARVLNELGKPKEAEATLRLLIETHPGDATPWLQLLMLQVSQRNLKEAAVTVEQIRERVKTARPELLWAQCYRVVDNNDRANACYQDALKRWPDDVAVHSAAIGFFEQTNRKAEAEASLRHVLKLDPALGWASRKLALILASREGDVTAWDEALKLVGPTDKADDAPDDRFARASVLAKGPGTKPKQQAIVILEKLAAELPNATAVHELLARLQRSAGQTEQARVHAMRAAGENANPEAILLYASILLNEKAFDEADRQLDRLVKLDPNSLAVAELRARIQLAKGQGEDAEAGLERAFAARVDTPEALAVGEKMIGLLLQLQRPDAATRVAQRVGQLGPRGACAEGMFLAGRGRLDEAVARLEEAAKAGDTQNAGTSALVLASVPGADARWLPLADRFVSQDLKQRPNSIETLQKMARVRYLQGRFDEQIKLYQAILKLEPGDYTFLNDMAWTLSEDLNQPKEGLEYVDELLKRAGFQANVLDTRGVILTRLDRLDEAIKDLETAAESQPSGVVYFHLARAYQKKGRTADFEKARDQAKQARLSPEQLQPSERSDWKRIMED
ncbi:tetratricopeptide repeat protein (plasmid) [Singulisphaera sp. Ch08]|uniref:Tetratricopeptide repeat protein n=1 Tax=Singulisphaera sp. Ch08 TaxID=3120278 RepID=A0AAU7CSJ3_9BACT